MTILVAGVGSLGSFLTLSLCQDLPAEHEITILDMDVVEERNMRNQVYSPQYIGVPKVESLQDIVYSQYERDIRVINKNIMDVSGEDLRKSSLIIDCFDNHQARWLLKSERNLQLLHPDFELLHIGFSENMTFAIEWDEGYKVPFDIVSGFDICTELGAGSFIRMVAALGSQVIQEFLLTGKKLEFLGNKFSITKIS